MPVFINNESDYLGPSQACVNPLFAAPPPPKPSAPQSTEDGARASASAPVHGGEPTGGNVGAPPAAPTIKRRTRQRRAPRVIKCEDDDAAPQITPRSAPVKLANNDDEANNNTFNTPQQTPSAIHATTQTIAKKAKATVTLSDCLSCSGCVTSAEAVLVSHHSVDRLKEVAGEYQTTGKHLHRRRIVFTISPASLGDLYRHLYLEEENEGEEEQDVSHYHGEHTNAIMASDETKEIPTREEFLQLVTIFLQSEFGAEAVVDGAVAQRISLMESASEFCYRYRESRRMAGDGQKGKEGSVASRGTSHPAKAELPSIALSSTKTRFINKDPKGQATTNADDDVMEVTTLTHPPGRIHEGDGDAPSGHPQPISPAQSNALPMLASSCPGFVCLVEKTAPKAVVLLSSAKSPVAVAGTLLKASERRGKPPPGNGSEASKGTNEEDRPSYHVAIMPCHDKKLEAGRGDFVWERQALLRYGQGAEAHSGNASGNASSKKANEGSSNEEEEELVNEVDLVLTTGELLEILGESVSNPSEHIVSSTVAIRQLFDSYRNHCSFRPLAPVSAEGDATTSAQGASAGTGGESGAPQEDAAVHGSGSYADFIFRYAARDLFDCALPRDQPLPWKGSSSAYSATGAATAGKSIGVIRRRRRRQETTDLREVALYKHSDGTYSCEDDSNDGQASIPVLRFATAYGFKNVQLVLQSLSKSESSKPSPYDYVEVMACPSGCSNGGGQVGAQGQREAPSDTKERVRKTVSAVPILRPADECGSLSASLCGCNADELTNDYMSRSKHFDEKARRLFHTRFHVVPELELSTGATAGVAVNDTQW